MAEIILFHHAHGLTEGMRALAARLRAAGHTVHTPDSYAGVTFDDLDEGVRHALTIGHDAVEDVARRAARQHRHADVVMGFSLGTMQAQLLAQDLRRIRACLLMGGALPPAALGGFWRPHVGLQIHVAEPDEWVEQADLAGLVRHAPHSDVYHYQGKGHMFVDPSCGDYDADAADLFEDRLDEWLAHMDEETALAAER